MSDIKYFKLGQGQGIFWDPQQPNIENQKLVGNQIKALDLTPAVIQAKRQELIIAVEEGEYKEYSEKEAKAAVVAQTAKPEKPASKDEIEKAKAEAKGEVVASFNLAIDTLNEMHAKAVENFNKEIEALKTNHAAEIEALNAAHKKALEGKK